MLAPTDSPIKPDVIAKGHQQDQNADTPPMHATDLITPQPAIFSHPGLEYVPRPATVGPLSRLPDNLSPCLSALPSQGETIHSHGTVRSLALEQMKRVSADSPPCSEESVDYTTVPTSFSEADLSSSEDSLDHTDILESPPSNPAVNALARVPAHFHPLMRVLEQMRLTGCEQPLRSSVALRLLQDAKEIYKGSGKSNFKAYSAAAVEEGIVALGGMHGYAWISLSPEWHGKVPITAPSC